MDVEYFDGRSARPQPARLTVDGHTLVIDCVDGQRRLPLAHVQWSERQRHGPRMAHIAPESGGGALQATDPAAWDAFVRALPRLRESWVVRAQQSWRATALASLLLVAVLAGGYLWGVPLMSRGVLAVTPMSADATVGRLAMDSIDGRWLRPSRRPEGERTQLAARFAALVEASHPDAATRPPYTLRFHASTIGPNAFALPGGTIVVTDELLGLMQGREDAVLGVLAHEYGHVLERHGMRMLVQVSLLGAATGAALGDFSGVIAGAPALLGQMAYSRDAEREADEHSVRLMRAAGVSPDVMVEFFERVNGWRGSEAGRRRGADIDFGIAFSSHPADEERKAFFRAAAQR